MAQDKSAVLPFSFVSFLLYFHGRKHVKEISEYWGHEIFFAES